MDPAIAAQTAATVPPRRIRSLRFWLAVLVVACTLPGGVACALYLGYEYERGRDQMIRDALGTARALTAVVDRDLAGSRAALQALASSPSLKSGDFARFHQEAREVQREINVNNIVLIGRDRRHLVNTLLPHGSALPEEQDPSVLSVFDTGRPVVTDLFVGAVARRPLLAIGVPVLQQGAVAYVLAAGVWPERLSRVLVQQRLPQGWIAAVFDSTGTVVARTHEIDRFIGGKAAPQLLARLGQNAEDALESTTLEGVQVVSVYSRSAVSKWSVAIGIPRDLLAAPWRRSLLVLLAGTVLVLGSALAASWFIGRHLAHAMRALVPPALALGQGHAVQVPPLPLAEANEVAGALNRTSMLLQQAMQRALHDPLTGLPNRTLFDQFLASQIAVCRRTGASLSVLYLDLDGFKRVNDRHGHAIGDELLRRVAGCLEHSVRESDLPARLGGDEFAVVLVDTGEEGAARVAQQLQAALLRPGDETTSAPNVAASIGIAEFPQAADSAEALLRRADEAMYEAKTTNGRPVFAPHRGRHRHHDAS